jgi:hypothetical protein
MLSDRNPEFMSGFSQAPWRRLGTRLSMSSNRNPETAGLTERISITFQNFLQCFCYYDRTNWKYLLPQVKFAYHAALAFGIEHTLFEANFGFSPEEPLDVLISMRP